MLKLRVIPCLDVKAGGSCKGVNFIDLRDAGDPVEQAAVYDAAGADELCFLDITASHENRATILDVVARTAARIFLPLTVGGGIRSIDDMRRLLLAGPTSAASTRPYRPAGSGRGRPRRSSAANAWWWRWTPNAPVAGTWEVFTHGGRAPQGSTPSAGAGRWRRLGAGEILLTSMDRDGTGEGFDLDLLRAACGAVRVPVIASGGVGTLAHFVEGARRVQPGCSRRACFTSACSPSPTSSPRSGTRACRCG